MIKLKKGPVPDILQRKTAEWTRQILEKIEKGEELTRSEKTRYNHQDIKSAILKETNNKCAYCESKVRHVTYGDIEHILPKSIVPERFFDWENLTLACDVCNGNKSDFYGDHDAFVDPYRLDPADHLWFIGPLIFARPGSDAGALTERILKLNRAELVERRKERLEGLMKHFEVIERTSDVQLKRELLNDFLLEAADEKEFAGLARDLLNLMQSRVGMDWERMTA